MKYESFLYSQRDGIATVRLNNPEQLNALTFQVYEELEALMRDLRNDGEVKVVVLTGEGKGFCSGGSVDGIIGRLVEMKGDELYKFTRLTCNVVQNMRRLEKPIIAAVNGIAAGGGSVLALAADYRVLSERARFAFLFVKVGLSGADMGALYLLPRIIGQGRALELLTLGDTIDAQEAYRIGLTNRVVPHEKLMAEAFGLALRLKSLPLHAIGITKRLLNAESNLDLDTALEREARAQAECMENPDFLEGYRAFMERRKPRFNRS